MNARSLLAFVTMAICTAPAVAHAFLQHAQPGAGATLKVSPSRVSLSFSEKLEPAFSGMAVSDSSGRNVEAGSAVIRGNSMIVALRSLPPGAYRVAWHVVSIDAHRTEGAYRFMVKP